MDFLRKPRKGIVSFIAILAILLSLASINLFAEEGPPYLPSEPHSTAAVYISGGERISTNEYVYTGEYDVDISVADGAYGLSGTRADGVLLTSGDYKATGIVVKDGEFTFGGEKDYYTVYTSIDDDYVGTSVEGGKDEIGQFNSVLLFGVDDVVKTDDPAESSGIDVGKDATVYINNAYLQVDGARRYVACNFGKMIVNDSYLVATGKADGKSDVVSDFFAMDKLLISGSARANYSAGTSNTYYFNSTVVAEGWGALSTDAAQGLNLYAYNTEARALNGGYGTYADTNCNVELYGCDVQSAEIGAIISSNGSITIDESNAAGSDILQYNTGASENRESIVKGGRNAVMIHVPDMMGAGIGAAQTGKLTVRNSKLATTKALKSTFDYSTYNERYGADVGAYVDYVSGDVILVKSTSADIKLENVDMASYNGVLVHTVINSDAMGNFLQPGDNDKVDPVSVTMTDMDVEGDILHEDYQRNMVVDLKDTTLKGAIVKGTYDSWKALWEAKGVTSANWLPDESWSGSNSLEVNVGAGSTWVVTEDSSLTKLTVAEGASVVAPEGYSLTMTVNGVATPIEAGRTYEGEIVIKVKGYIYDPATKTLTVNGTYTVEETTTLNKLILGANGKIEAKEGYLVTLVVNGVETKISAGKTYEGNVALALTEDYSASPLGSYKGRGGEEYRAALYVDNTGIVAERSVTEAIQGGAYDDEKAEGIKVESTGDNFNGVIVNGAAYTIKDSEFDFLSDSDGSNVSDFTGFGAVISAFNDAKVTLDNVNIYTEGVARPGIFTDSGSDTLVKDSNITVMGGTLYEGYVNTADQTKMVAPPWVLGITGNARATNLMGEYSSITVVNSNVTANQWGVLSSDTGSDMLMTVVDSTLTLKGEGQNDPFSENYGSGYGSYIIGNAQEYFYGVTFNVGTYASILREGKAVYASSDFTNGYVKEGSIDIIPPGQEVPVFTDITGSGRKTVINSDAFGFMAHGSGTLIITDGTEVNTDNAAFLIKNGNVDIEVTDGARINTGDGILLQMIDDDDQIVGATFGDDGSGPIFNTDFYEEEGYPGIDYPVTINTDNRNTVNFYANAVELKGNLYNGTGYFKGMFGPGNQAADILNVTLDNAKLEGAISSTSVIHVDENGNQNTHFTINEYYYLGHVANKEFYNGGNDVNVTLKNGAVWNVTGKSVLKSLSIDGASSVVAPEGYTLTMTVDGVETALAAGNTYEGEIVIEVTKVSGSGSSSGSSSSSSSRSKSSSSSTTSSNKVEKNIQLGSTTVAEIANAVKVALPPGTVTGTNAVVVLEIVDSSLAENAGKSLLSKVVDITLQNGTLSGKIAITLNFDSSKLPAGYRPVVFYYDENKNAWKRIGGKYDLTQGTITVEVDHLTAFAVFAGKTFADIQGHWAQEEIEQMADMGIAGGVSSDSFAPDSNVTRAQFVALLIRSLGIEETLPAEASFKDVNPNSWYYGAVEAAQAEGLVSGYTDGTFRPEQNITREEIAAMVVRAMAKSGVYITADDTALAAFADKDAISSWAREAVAQAVKAGIARGRADDCFAPKENATRAEAAVMLKRMLAGIGQISQ
ncbi:MAG: S-layer homology domain-containing protein [Moorellaceae bacterium]